MSIRQAQQIKELFEKVENLERAMNKLNQTPRTVAGEPDPDAKPKVTGKKTAKKEGDEA